MRASGAEPGFRRWRRPATLADAVHQILLELYGVGLDLRLDNAQAVIDRTDGVSPAFIKELLRKASLLAAHDTRSGELVVTDAHVNAALDELLAETGSLTRLLLGGATDRPPPTIRASMGWLPGAGPAVARPEGAIVVAARPTA